MKRARFIVAMVISAGLMMGTVGSATAQAPTERATVKTSVDKKNNGTAKITANVSTSGKVSIRGSKIKSKSKTVSSAKKVRLKVKPDGQTKKKLKKKGKAKVKVFLKFTPSNAGGGPYSPSTGQYDPYTPNDPVVKKKLKITLKLKAKGGNGGGKGGNGGGKGGN